HQGRGGRGVVGRLVHGAPPRVGLAQKKFRKRAGSRGARNRATPPEGASSARTGVRSARTQYGGRSVRPGCEVGGRGRNPFVKSSPHSLPEESCSVRPDGQEEVG